MSTYLRNLLCTCASILSEAVSLIKFVAENSLGWFDPVDFPSSILEVMEFVMWM